MDKIIELNKTYLEKEKQLKKELEELKKVNNQIDLEQLKTLSYEEVKEIKALLEWKVDTNIKKQIDNIYSSKKKEKFPILTQVRYFPIIKEINFLSEEEKVMLDKYLGSQAMSYYLFDFAAWFDLLFTEKQTTLIQEFLHKKGVIRAMYYYEAECSCNNGEWFAEEEIEKYMDKYKDPENWEKLSIYCGDCDDCMEIETIEKLENPDKVGYKLKMKANRDSDKL